MWCVTQLSTFVFIQSIFLLSCTSIFCENCTFQKSVSDLNTKINYLEALKIVYLFFYFVHTYIHTYMVSASVMLTIKWKLSLPLRFSPHPDVWEVQHHEYQLIKVDYKIFKLIKNKCFVTWTGWAIIDVEKQWVSWDSWQIHEIYICCDTVTCISGARLKVFDESRVP